jgi:hypothetical protein
MEGCLVEKADHKGVEESSVHKCDRNTPRVVGKRRKEERLLSHSPTCHWTSHRACLLPPCSAQADQVSQRPACSGTFSFLLAQRYLRHSAESTVK